MNDSIRTFVRVRAGERCEYCRLPSLEDGDLFSVDHVIAKKHGGSDDPANLAMCCMRCNVFKGTDLSGVDPVTGQVVRLFDPRQDKWDQHFRFDDAAVAGLTATGRATVATLRMNAAERVALRQVMRER